MYYYTRSLVFIFLTVSITILQDSKVAFERTNIVSYNYSSYSIFNTSYAP